MFGIDIFDASLAPAMIVALLAGCCRSCRLASCPSCRPICLHGRHLDARDDGRGRGAAPRHPARAVLCPWPVDRLPAARLCRQRLRGVLPDEPDAVHPGGRVVVIIFGLHFLGVFRIPILDREARLDAGDRGGSALGAFVLGLAFAAGWTPCIGPQLGAILSLAAQEGSVARGTVLLGVYAVGLGLPFLLAALFISRAMG